jgi:hypothetical protein
MSKQLKRLRLGLVAVTAVLIAVGAMFFIRPVAAQPKTLVKTEGGLRAEEVRVGGSCVVVVWRGNDASGQLAAVPCSH